MKRTRGRRNHLQAALDALSTNDRSRQTLYHVRGESRPLVIQIVEKSPRKRKVQPKVRTKRVETDQDANILGREFELFLKVKTLNHQRLSNWFYTWLKLTQDRRESFEEVTEVVSDVSGSSFECERSDDGPYNGFRRVIEQIDQRIVDEILEDDVERVVKPLGTLPRAFVMWRSRMASRSAWRKEIASGAFWRVCDSEGLNTKKPSTTPPFDEHKRKTETLCSIENVSVEKEGVVECYQRDSMSLESGPEDVESSVKCDRNEFLASENANIESVKSLEVETKSSSFESVSVETEEAPQDSKPEKVDSASSESLSIESMSEEPINNEVPPQIVSEVTPVEPQNIESSKEESVEFENEHSLENSSEHFESTERPTSQNECLEPISSESLSLASPPQNKIAVQPSHESQQSENLKQENEEEDIEVDFLSDSPSTHPPSISVENEETSSSSDIEVVNLSSDEPEPPKPVFSSSSSSDEIPVKNEPEEPNLSETSGSKLGMPKPADAVLEIPSDLLEEVKKQNEVPKPKPQSNLLRRLTGLSQRKESKEREYIRQFFTEDAFNTIKEKKSKGQFYLMIEIPKTVQKPFTISKEASDLIVDLLNETVDSSNLNEFHYESFLDYIEKLLNSGGQWTLKQRTTFPINVSLKATKEHERAQIETALAIAEAITQRQLQIVLNCL